MLRRVFQGDLTPGRGDFYMNYYDHIYLDSETTGLDPRIDSMQVVQLYVPGQPVDIVMLEGCTPIDLVRVLSSEKTFVIQHAPFDMGFIFQQFGLILSNVYCTRLAEKLISPLSKHGLFDLVYKYFGVKIDKSRREFPEWSNPTEDDLDYMCRDMVFLPTIHRFQQLALEELDLTDFAQEIFDHLPTHVRLQALGYENIYGYGK